MTKFLDKLFIKDYDKPALPEVRERFGVFSSVLGVIVNIIIATAKLIVGLLVGSISITADAVNNFSDAGASIVSFVSFKIASKPADRDHPFGHARIEYVCSMVVAFLILLVGVELMTESFAGFFAEREHVDAPKIAVYIILGVSILAKLFLAVHNRRVGKLIDSGVVSASATDSLMDAVSTLAVLVCSIVIDLTGLWFLDSIVGIAVSVMILIAGLRILNETKNSLLGEAPVDEVVVSIKEIVAKYPEVVGVHDMLVHNYGPNHYIASFHAEVNGEEDIYELHDAIDNAEQEIFAKLGIVCTIHLDPIAVNDEKTNELKCLAIEAARSVDNDITIHDFRAVIGNTHTNIIFDIVLPFESKLTEKEAIAAVSCAVSELRKDVNCVIKVDRG